MWPTLWDTLPPSSPWQWRQCAPLKHQTT
jgi:hypothetical protein